MEPNMAGEKVVKRRNHEVPKGLLKNWLSTSSGQTGHHYIGIAPSTSGPTFETGGNANFAITDYIYVPFVNSTERDDTLEDWFATDESGLAPFAKAAQSGQLDEFDNPKLMNQALRACVALGYRSAYHFFMVAELLDQNDEISETGAPHFEAVRNAWSVFDLKFKQFLNWDFLVLHDLPGSLMVNEQPFRDWTLRKGVPAMVTMALGPNTLLVGSPPKDVMRRETHIRVSAAPERSKLVELHNHIVVETARQWIVATNEAQLAEIAPRLTDELVLQRRRTDREVFFVTKRR